MVRRICKLRAQNFYFWHKILTRWTSVRYLDQTSLILKVVVQTYTHTHTQTNCSAYDDVDNDDVIVVVDIVIVVDDDSDDNDDDAPPPPPRLHPFNGLYSSTTWVSQHQKGKPFWIYGFYWSKRWCGGSGINWTICKSFRPRSGQITMPVPHHQLLYLHILKCLVTNLLITNCLFFVRFLVCFEFHQ